VLRKEFVFIYHIGLNSLRINSQKMSLALADDGIWFDFLVHEILSFAIGHVLVLDEVEVIASEVVELILHLPDL
jgi:hypothetical protein